MCRHRRNCYGPSPVLYGPMTNPQMGQVQGQQYGYAYGMGPYCSGCGRHRCRCGRRQGCGGRGRRGGPVTMLIGGIISMVKEHQEKKAEERRVEGEKFVKGLRENDGDVQRRAEEVDEYSDSEPENDVAAREYEQHLQNREEERRRGKQYQDEPPSYKVAVNGN
ncbi:uncharacterized protein Z518_10654 [Rhinocladiella mackenziei CBS 650.93]|uniref:Rhinocladiella mackenziei CBS 650.93 unplaced genomic scaffold supercont1.9, whole genome shotgun sequence n=1 Tax=Rhinocladiella mackenziei CBS 650.93 TaxID=1442369 RepID=A0A0D2I447_9EURO|nr:uncharacterized protein Z518_10654 [Rhinocladiella mackenziei CBS 650.93]KIX00514.1 hypothetical protein Z518_10654 [Rhinocladiella mackenziei CBS 650.93]